MQISRKDFNNAVRICNAVSGTQDVMRIVEQHCLIKPDTRKFYNATGHQMVIVDKEKRYWNDVWELGGFLDEQGNYWHKGELLTEAHDIAQAMIQDGITWAKVKIVKAAQKRKR